jgi:hypothetical protein
MKRQIKLTSQSQENQQQITAQNLQESGAHEFATVEKMLRHDSLHTPVPPAIAQRLQESIGQLPAAQRSWWRRLFGS